MDGPWEGLRPPSLPCPTHNQGLLHIKFLRRLWEPGAGLSPLLAGVSQCLGGMADQGDTAGCKFLERQQRYRSEGLWEGKQLPKAKERSGSWAGNGEEDEWWQWEGISWRLE